jgi:uncharacterized protein (DUF488 family)
VYTIGYEGLSIEAFLLRLQDMRVQTLVDVRELPLSRKPGFSKRVLTEKLLEVGVRYVHLRQLGCPKSIRDSYRQTGNWSGYVRSFNAYLRTQQVTLRELAAISKGSNICLMCFEADFNYCHRSIVARHAQDFGAAPAAHITAQTTIPELRLAA